MSTGSIQNISGHDAVNNRNNRNGPRGDHADPSGRESVDNNVGFLLHDAARLMRVSYDRKMRALGLTRSQWWVLTHLYFHNGVSQTELSSLLDIERPSLGRLIDRLEEKGWVERRADASDRRVKRIYLTAEVDSIMRTMRQRAVEVRSQALDGFSAVEIDQLVQALKKMKANLLINGES